VNLKDQALRTTVLKALADMLYAEQKADRDDLMREIVAMYDATGGKTFDVKLPSGEKVATISLAISQAYPRVLDEDALVEWARENRPEWVREVPATTVLNLGRVIEDITFTEDGMAVDGNGELVPEVVLDPGGEPQSFQVRFAPSGRVAIERAWADGKFGAALPGVAPALPEVTP